MSAKNGDKSRYQIARKRGVHRRAAAKKLLEGSAPAGPAAAKRRVKPPLKQNA